MDLDERHAMRAERAAPLVERLDTRLRALRSTVLPKSALGEAITYTLNLWPRLQVFLTHPVVELSNNLAENAMRGIALGRKIWIHLGDAKAGPRVAAILSVHFRPRSRPNCGSSRLPVMAILNCAPAPSLEKKGSTGFSTQRFQRLFIICDNFASVRRRP